MDQSLTTLLALLLFVLAIGGATWPHVREWRRSRAKRQALARRVGGQEQDAEVDSITQRLGAAARLCQAWQVSDQPSAQIAAVRFEPQLRRARRMLPGLRAQAIAGTLHHEDAGLQTVRLIESLLSEMEQTREQLRGAALVERTGILRPTMACASPDMRRDVGLARRQEILQRLEGEGATTDFGALGGLETDLHRRSVDRAGLLAGLLPVRRALQAGSAAVDSHVASPASDQLSWIGSSFVEPTPTAAPAGSGSFDDTTSSSLGKARRRTDSHARRNS